MAALWTGLGGAWSVDGAGQGQGQGSGRRTLLVLGDSLAAGYGVDPREAYPGVLQGWIDRLGLSYEVVNAGVSGDTTAGGLRRLGWQLRRPVDILLIELGGNDGLRGLAPEATRTNLVSIIDTVRARRPGVRVVLSGMQMPPNMGTEYASRFRAVFPEVARDRGCVLVPHLLEGVGGVPSLNLPDLIHPTPEGHRVVASNIWVVLKPLLEVASGR
jgi:acyl-CoA thioesterase-1